MASCLMWSKPGASQCQSCKSANYCSKKCQKADWPIHKILCRTFSDFAASSRPSADHIRAIVFAENEEKPKFAWVYYDDDEDEGTQSPSFDELLGPAKAHLAQHLIRSDEVLKKQLSDSIFFSFSDNFLIDGSEPTKSISPIANTMPTVQLHDWRGRLACYGCKGPVIKPRYLRDLDMNDFRYVADHLLSYNVSPKSSTKEDVQSEDSTAGGPARSPDMPKVQGVIINCRGDQDLGKPAFEIVNVAANDPILTSPVYQNGVETSDIAEMIELPILTRRLPHNPRWSHRTRRGSIPTNNQSATFLHQTVLESSIRPERATAEFGWAPMHWQSAVGSILVVRKDKKPLLPVHAEALCNYCQYEVGKIMEHTMGTFAPEIPMSKQQAMSMISRPAFIIWHENWKRRKIEADADGFYSDDRHLLAPQQM